VHSPTGLGPLFPELAVCYLICVLSLVGFPGTLGFIEEEVMLGQGVEHHRGLVGIIAIALTLNGFSSFRLFARIFYGQPFEGRDIETRLSVRERLVIVAVLAALVINGLAPSFLVETLTELSS
jgi:formate hydrogenlyase subunit 3/multisubunit Na+/H+ antiporter MnhD subunit